MKLSELTPDEMLMVADELGSRQIAIKRHIKARNDSMPPTRIKILNATISVLKKEAFDIRSKAMELKIKNGESKNEN